MDLFQPLFPGGPVYAGEGVTADSLALAAFAAQVPGQRAADLGCGCGILLLLLSHRRPELTVDGVELRERAAALCRENLRQNGLHRGTVVWADLRAHPLGAGQYDLAVSNPPYFPPGRGAVSPNAHRALMRTETASLPELCAAAAELLKPGGSFCLVHRKERQAEVLSALRSAGLSPLLLRELRRSGDAPARVFLVRAVRGDAALTLLPPLCQLGPGGAETEEYRKICYGE